MSSELGVAGIWALNPYVQYCHILPTLAILRHVHQQTADLRATLLDVSPKRPGTQMCKRATGGIA